MKDPAKLRDRILEKVDLGQVMLDYNVDFVYNPMKSDEVQFRCPFHGKDNKPSARYYRRTQSAFCWVCHKKFDVIAFIMEKVGLSYGGALRHLIQRYKISISDIPDGPDIRYNETVKSSDIPEVKRVIANINMKLQELKYKISFEKYNALCAVYNNLTFKVSENKDVSDMVKKLESKIYTLMEKFDG